MIVSGYILAGGKSSRMGSDKGLLLLENKQFVTYIFDALSEVCNSIIVVTSNHEYNKLGLKTIEDCIPNKGPVGGIYTVLKNTSTDLNLIISVDAPFVTSELLQWMLSNHKLEDQITLLTNQGKEIPLIAIYNSNLEPVFKKALDQDQLKLRDLVHSVKSNVLQVPEEFKNQIQNINTKEEYQNCLK
jgi:molybdopterin-guanine dinucleotide biosynthesis protein A